MYVQVVPPKPLAGSLMVKRHTVNVLIGGPIPSLPAKRKNMLWFVLMLVAAVGGGFVVYYRAKLKAAAAKAVAEAAAKAASDLKK